MSANATATAHALSPLDGRYSESTREVATHFSEFALMRERVRVEIAHALKLESLGLFPKLTGDELTALQTLDSAFGEADYVAIKQHEASLRHDVKSCEVFLRERIPTANPNRYHFALTSEDVNNLAYARMLQGYVDTQLTLWRGVLGDLVALAKAWRDDGSNARATCHTNHGRQGNGRDGIALACGGA
jgi:adenylosuccinate lyase